jgi:hypothetical protein
MEEKIANAYLHMLYKCLVEIRSISVFRRKWWNPFTWGKQNKYFYLINRLSNAFHNIPYNLKTDNSDKIDEDYFWKQIEEYENLKKRKSYKQLYNKIISGEKRKILD